MELVIQILIVFLAIVASYFGLSALYFLFFSAGYHLYREKRSTPKSIVEKKNVAVLLPAYKEDAVILESAREALAHQSELANLQTWVMADKLQPETIAELRNMGAKVVEVKFKKSTKSKSLNEAMKQVPETTDYVVVLDADNVMQEGFIDRILDRLQKGFKVVQGHRTSKNNNTTMAVLDSISEEVNNSIFRMGHRVFGLSASLIGSGFACEYHLFKELMNQAQAVGGFDKEMEINLLERKIRIGYARRAIVLDEKVQKEEVFVNQRRRWLSAQLVYFRKNLGKAFKLLLLKGNIDFFDKIVQFLLPPRIIALGVSVMFTLLHIGFLFFPQLTWNMPFTIAWSGILILNALAIMLAIPRRLYNKKLLNALFSLPGGFLLTILAILKLKGANKTFIHTTHGIADGPAGSATDKNKSTP